MFNAWKEVSKQPSSQPRKNPSNMPNTSEQAGAKMCQTQANYSWEEKISWMRGWLGGWIDRE